mmetsp:Transcript_1394/g.4290  ORF Transcript_1394/g.4290 Transcript_1394/m.4290 type:complete len:215 (+) Transcript_1394:130-774(+)
MFTTDGETSASGDTSTDVDERTWIAWFCSLKGNEFYCEIEEDFIQDDFNLSGLSNLVPYYHYALDVILDVEVQDVLSEQQSELIESAAEMLYGLIHARYILTTRGMIAMMEKYKHAHFGRCPRYLCNNQPCLPTGTSDVFRTATVKLFCPNCQDLYFPRSKYQGNVDGAYFGTTFPHLFLMTYSHLKHRKNCTTYTPRIFGFKVSMFSKAASLK